MDLSKVNFTRTDVSSPELLERLLRRILEASSRELTEVRSLAEKTPDIKSLARLLRREFEAPGAAPINITNLIGVPAQAVKVLQDTHANRTNYPAADNVNNLYKETDRGVVFIARTISGIPAWVYAGGIYVDVIANRPADLGTNDKGFKFWGTDAAQLTEFVWSGAAWFTSGGQIQQLDSAVTNAVSTLLNLIHRTSGTAAVGFGGRILTELEDASGVEEDASAVDTLWTTATSGSETSDWRVLLRSAGAALAEKLRLTAAGLLKLFGGYFSSADATTPTSESRFGLGAFTAGEHAVGTVTNNTFKIYVNNTLVATFDASLDSTFAGWLLTPTAKGLKVNGNQVVTDRQGAISDPNSPTGTPTDSSLGAAFGFASAAEMTTFIADVGTIQNRVMLVLDALQAHGLIET